MRAAHSLCPASLASDVSSVRLPVSALYFLYASHHASVETLAATIRRVVAPACTQLARRVQPGCVPGVSGWGACSPPWPHLERHAGARLRAGERGWGSGGRANRRVSTPNSPDLPPHAVGQQQESVFMAKYGWTHKKHAELMQWVRARRRRVVLAQWVSGTHGKQARTCACEAATVRASLLAAPPGLHTGVGGVQGAHFWSRSRVGPRGRGRKRGWASWRAFLVRAFAQC